MKIVNKSIMYSVMIGAIYGTVVKFLFKLSSNIAIAVEMLAVLISYFGYIIILYLLEKNEN